MANDLPKAGIELIVQGMQRYASSARTINSLNKQIGKSATDLANKFVDLGRRGTESQEKVVNAAIRMGQQQLRLAAQNQRATSSIVREMTKIAQEEAKLRNEQEKTKRSHESTLQARVRASAEMQKSADRVRIAETRANSAIVASNNRLQGSLAALEAKKLSTLQASLGLSGGMGGLGSIVQRVIGIFKGLQGGMTAAKAGTIALAAGMAALKITMLAIGGVVKVASLGINALKSAFNALLSPLKKVISEFDTFIKRVAAVATGVLIRDMIFAVVNALHELNRVVKESVVEFQTLEVRVENLAARQARLSGMTEDLGESMSIGADYAKYFTQWVKELSLIVPIDANALANTAAFSMAMGFGAEEAQKLTLSIGGYTAAMGLSSEVMERIIFNFGQMKAQGKVTSTEMRDLARGAFFPLTDVLNEAADMLGVTAGNMLEFRKAAAEGAISIDVFFDAFQRVVERDFPGALEKFGRTAEGVRIRFLNFIKTVVGLEVFGPVFKRIVGGAADLLDRLTTPENINNARILGVALDKSFAMISNAVKTLIASLGTLARAFGLGGGVVGFVRALAYASAYTSAFIKLVADIVNWLAGFLPQKLSDIASNMYKYGGNIVTQIARGMAAAVQAIVNVIKRIAAILSSWFKPGSPPRVAPDIDKWGLETMNEWLHGFLLADFDMLDSVQSRVKSALDVFADLGEISEDAAREGFVEISKSLAQAISEYRRTGRIGTKVFEDLRSVGGVLGKELAELLKVQIEYTDALLAAEAAQKALKAAQEATGRARTAVSKLVREYNALIRSGATQVEIQQKLAQLNAAEIGLQVAKDQEKAAEEAAKAAEAALDPARERVKIQEEILDQLLEFAKAQVLPKETTSGAGGGGGGGAEIPTEDELFSMPPLPAFEVPEFDLGIDIDAIFAEAEASAKAFFERLRTFFETKWNELFGEGSGFSKAVEKMSPVLENAWERMKSGLLLAWDLIKAAVGAAVDTILETMGDLGLTAEDIGNALQVLKVNFLIALGVVAAVVVGIANGLVRAFGAIITGLSWIKQGWDLIVDSIKRIVDGIKMMFEGNLLEGAQKITMGIIDLITGLFQFIIGYVISTLGTVISFVVGFVLGIIEWFKKLYDRLVGNSIIPDMLNAILDWFKNIFTKISEFVADILEKIKSFVKEKLEAVKQFFVEKLEAIWSKVKEIYENIESKIREKIEAAEKLVKDKLESIRKYFSEKFEAARDIVKEVFDAIKEKIHDIVEDVHTFIKDKLAEIGDFFDNLGDRIKEFRDNILESLRSKFEAVSAVILKVKDFIWDLIGAITSLNLGKIAELVGLLFGGGGGGKQFGGRVYKGQAEIVGERGIELFVPPVTGTIVPMSRVSAYPVLASGGESVNLEFNTTITGPIDAEMFQRRVVDIVKRII